jgi:hypothetical protein
MRNYPFRIGWHEKRWKHLISTSLRVSEATSDRQQIIFTSVDSNAVCSRINTVITASCEQIDQRSDSLTLSDVPIE